MICVKLISGLGNQLFQYTIGRQLSLINNTPLKLDASFFSGQKLRSYKLDKYQINAEVLTDEEFKKFLHIYKSKTLYAKVYRKLEKSLPKTKRFYFKENRNWEYDPQLFDAMPNVYLDGYWQHYKYFENIAPVIFDELTVTENYSQSVNKIVDSIKNAPSSVSLHIRRGDYITDTEAFNLFGITPVEYYLKAIEYMKSQLKNICLYVFSDDLNWAEQNLKYNLPTTYIDIENGTMDYIELDLMSKCQHNIIANSSFSWWGAFLNRNPSKIVIGPKNWVKNDSINNRIHILPPNWVKI